MNIFVVDRDPKISAQMLCDKHIIKMILESCQMLSTAIWYSGFQHLKPKEFAVSHSFCKPCYINHPCTQWVRQNKENFMWLYNHGKALCEEKLFRYFNNPPHKRQSDYDRFLHYLDFIPSGDLEPFAQEMPEQYKCVDTVKAYRDYYIGKKKHILYYTRRQVPHWLQGLATQK